jgi:SAM-dependent methyltransferase
VTSSDPTRYWQRIHWNAAHTGSHDALLAAVCDPYAPAWYNARLDRLQQRAFWQAIRRCGDLRGRAVLEVGCGYGRWSRRLRDSGADVLAVDASSDAIAIDRATIPGVRFEVADITGFEAERNAFDVVLSVTVLQHLPFPAQEQVIAKLVRSLKPEGYVVALENIRDRAPHVFSRSISAWQNAFERQSLQVVDAIPYEYDLLIRAARWPLVVTRRSVAAETPRPPRHGWQRNMKSVYWEVIIRPAALASAMLEPVAQRLMPRSWATHCALVCQKAAGG